MANSVLLLLPLLLVAAAGASSASDDACAGLDEASLVPDPDDCHAYVVCYPEDGEGGGDLVADARVCPDGTAYDDDVKLWVSLCSLSGGAF